MREWHSSQSGFGRLTGNNISGHYKQHSFLFSFLSNSSQVFRPVKSLDQELTLFQPYHQKKNNKNTPPKSIRRVCTRRQKFDKQTTHELLAEFRGLGVQLTLGTRRTLQKSAIAEEPNSFLAQNFSNVKFFRNQTFFQNKIFF